MSRIRDVEKMKNALAQPPYVREFAKAVDQEVSFSSSSTSVA